MDLGIDVPAAEPPAPVASAEEVDGDGDGGEDPSTTVYNYPAWKTFPVRVNNLAPTTKAEDLMKAFALVSSRNGSRRDYFTV